MIELYKATNTNFSNHGDIVLSPFSCVIQAEINGTWGLSLTHPLDKEGKFKELVTGAVIKAPSFNGSQLFRIRNIVKADDGVIAEADPIFLDARGDAFIESVHPTNATGQQALTAMCSVNSKYSGTSNIATENTAYFEQRNLIDAIAGDSPSFMERWGGEVLYNNFEIIINDRIGGDYGVKVLYGKNLAGVRETVNVDNVVTRIYPYAYNGHTLADNGYVDSPIIASYPTIHAQKRVYENIKLAQDVTGEEPQATDIICADLTELRQALINAVNDDYNNGADKPTISLEVDMVLLKKTTAYKDFADLETVSLGDTVHCKHAILGIESDARVVSLTYDSIRKGVTSVVLNSERASLFNQLSGVVKAVARAITPDGDVKAEQIQGFIDGTLAQLRLQNTIAKRQDVRAILFEDLDPDSTTFGALSIGTQGIQISKERTADGRDWVWTTAATSEGIIAGTLIAQEQLAVAKHFFADATGVHITEDEYDATTGKNVLIDSDSFDIRDGETSLASISATNVDGKINGSFAVNDEDGNPLFAVGCEQAYEHQYTSFMHNKDESIYTTYKRITVLDNNTVVLEERIGQIKDGDSFINANSSKKHITLHYSNVMRFLDIDSEYGIRLLPGNIGSEQASVQTTWEGSFACIGKDILANDDLNDYRTPGEYACRLNTTVATLTNCPVTNAFRMTVTSISKSLLSVSYTLQNLTDYYGNEYMRRGWLTNNTWNWTAWARKGDLRIFPLAVTRTNNPYCDATAVNRLSATAKNGFMYFYGNLYFTNIPASQSSFTEIARISDYSGSEYFGTIPTQNGTTAITVYISSSGVVSIANFSTKATGNTWARFGVTLPLGNNLM